MKRDMRVFRNKTNKSSAYRLSSANLDNESSQSEPESRSSSDHKRRVKRACSKKRRGESHKQNKKKPKKVNIRESNSSIGASSHSRASN